MYTSCCCPSFGFVCGCKKNTSIKVLWAFLIILAITSCLVLGCVIYSPQRMLASPSDMHAVDTHVHFLFCESVTLDSELSFNAYIVHGTPEIDPLSREMINWSSHLLVGANSYNYFALYLLTGSRIQISNSAITCISFYVIDGKDNFDLWAKHQRCDSCYVNNSNVCMGHSNTVVMETANNDEYYFVYSNKNNNRLLVNFQLNVNRTLYNIRDATSSCVDTVSCSVALDGPDKTVVYMVDKEKDIGINNHPELLTACVPRIWSYLLLHGVTILLIGMTGSCVIKKLRQGSEISRYNRSSNCTTENTTLLNSSFPPSYSSVTLEPPKYEDVMCYKNPPPYLEATKLLSDRRTIVANTNISDSDNLSVQVASCASENASH